MTQASLLVLAAGMGSRYGGLKQMEALGPNGETLLDYSIYDAVKAGFSQVVFVIRRDIGKDFIDLVGARFEKHLDVRYVYQEIDLIPGGFNIPESRTKPWGTAHAIMMGAGEIDFPFAVINADDYYGFDGFHQLYQAFQNNENENLFHMVAYQLKNTLTPHGHVSRGVCEIDSEGFLKTVSEHKRIQVEDGKPVSHSSQGSQILDPLTPVSMNLWGFTPKIFRYLKTEMEEFLRKNIRNPDAEYQIPTVVDDLIQRKMVQVKMLQSEDSWFGVTYKNDREKVEKRIQDLVREGRYPTPAFSA